VFTTRRYANPRLPSPVPHDAVVTVLHLTATKNSPNSDYICCRATFTNA